MKAHFEIMNDDLLSFTGQNGLNNVKTNKKANKNKNKKGPFHGLTYNIMGSGFVFLQRQQP